MLVKKHFVISFIFLTLTFSVFIKSNKRQYIPNPKFQSKTYTLKDFAKLKWLEGDWKGQMENKPPFFARYKFANDSVIISYSYRDSAMINAADSSTIFLHNGAIYDKGSSAIWVATKVDSANIHFVPYRYAMNQFTWKLNPDGSWSTYVSLRNSKETGATEYVMRRISR